MTATGFNTTFHAESPDPYASARRDTRAGSSIARGNDQAGLQILVDDRAANGRLRWDHRIEGCDLDLAL
jgi:hypothetical protein